MAKDLNKPGERKNFNARRGNLMGKANYFKRQWNADIAVYLSDGKNTWIYQSNPRFPKDLRMRGAYRTGPDDYITHSEHIRAESANGSRQGTVDDLEDPANFFTAPHQTTPALSPPQPKNLITSASTTFHLRGSSDENMEHDMMLDDDESAFWLRPSPQSPYPRAEPAQQRSPVQPHSPVQTRTRMRVARLLPESSRQPESTRQTRSSKKT